MSELDKIVRTQSDKEIIKRVIISIGERTIYDVGSLIAFKAEVHRL